MSKPKENRTVPEKKILILLTVLLAVGLVVIFLSRWIRAEFGRIIYGGSEARPFILDTTILGVGSAIVLVAIIAMFFSIRIGRRLSRAIEDVGTEGIAFPAERISRSLSAATDQRIDGLQALQELPYYLAVSLSRSSIDIWGKEIKPIARIRLSNVSSVRIARDGAPSARRVMSISTTTGGPEFSVSVMSSQWLILPETNEERLDEIQRLARKSHLESE